MSEGQHGDGWQRTHMRENKFLPHCHGDESTAGRKGGWVGGGGGTVGHRLTCCS